MTITVTEPQAKALAAGLTHPKGYVRRAPFGVSLATARALADKGLVIHDRKAGTWRLTELGRAIAVRLRSTTARAT